MNDEIMYIVLIENIVCAESPGRSILLTKKEAVSLRAKLRLRFPTAKYKIAEVKICSDSSCALFGT